MTTLEEFLATHAILETERERRRRVVQRRFAPWLPSQPPDLWQLCLYPFAAVRPLRYLLDDSISGYLHFLCSNRKRTVEALETYSDEVTRAVEAITTPSATWRDEEALDLKTADDYARFDQVWHPEYHRYAEHAFNHLVQVPLSVLGKAKHKDYTSQTLSNRVATLRRESALASLTEGFDSALRNSIAHGSVRFTQFKMLYLDRKRSLEFYPDGFARKLECLVKSTQTLTVGLLLFLLHDWSVARRRGLEKLPLGFLYLAVWGAATHRDFELQRVVPSEIADGRKQLNIVTKTPVTSRAFHQYVCLHLVKEIDDLGGPRFDRAVLSIHCGRKIPSSMVVDMAHMRRARRRGLPATELQQIVEGSLLWHDSPSLLQKVNNLRLAVQTVWANHKEGVVQEWRRHGWIVAGSLYELRATSNRSVERMRRLEGRAVLKDGVEPNYRDVRGVALHAVRCLRRTRIRASRGLSRDTLLKRRPGHVWLVVYEHDDFARRFSGRLMNNDDVLVEAEWKSRWSKSGLTFVQDPDEVKGRVRLKYSPRLLNS